MISAPEPTSLDAAYEALTSERADRLLAKAAEVYALLHADPDADDYCPDMAKALEWACDELEGTTPSSEAEWADACEVVKLRLADEPLTELRSLPRPARVPAEMRETRRVS